MRNVDRDLDRAVALHAQAEALRAGGADLAGKRLARARKACVTALALFERHEGPSHPDVANVLVALAEIDNDRGDYAAALASAERAVSILKRFPMRGENATILARLRVRALDVLGAVHVSRGAYDLAGKSHREALAVATAKLPRDEAAASANALAIVYKYTGRYDEAEKLYRRALAIAERQPASRERDATLATLFHNLGGLEHSRGRFARAEPWARKSVTVRERAFGKTHVAVAADVAALAAILDGLGKHEEAEALYWRAIARFSRNLGPNHFEVAFNHAQLAVLYQGTNRLRLAQGSYTKALRMLERALGKKHPTVALTLANFGSLRRMQGNEAEAKKLYTRALGIYRATLGPRHADTKDCAAALAALAKTKAKTKSKSR